MNALLKSLIWFLYPAQCRHCGENLDPADGHYICSSCWDQVKYIDMPYCEKCGHPLDPASTLPEKVFFCADCPDEASFGKARSIAYYYDSATGEAIRLLKDNGKTIMAGKLADMMAKGVHDLLDVNDYDCIVPVPIHKKKLRKRGYNQMDLIGRKMSAKLGIPIDAQSLIKSVHTLPQRGLERRAERIENIKGSFSIIDPSKIAGKRVLLIDDVMTTGSTANECARVLMKEGKASNVDVLTLTRVVFSDLNEKGDLSW
jgi:ComF family protein